MGFIYKITNQVNGKLYIGKTELTNPIDRWKQHQKGYNRRKLERRPLYSAMKKYGVENFTFEVIDQENDSDKLCELEKFYIEKLRTYTGFEDCNGYNNTLGGDGKCYLKLDENEVIATHIDCNYIAGITARHFGVDADTIQKILEKHGIHWRSCTEITQLKYMEKYGGLIKFDYDMSKVINIYDAPKYVLQENPTYSDKTLSCAYRLNDPTHHAYGFTWYRISDLPEEYKPLLEEYYNGLKGGQ